MFGVGLGHFDVGPIFYGVVIFIGLWSVFHKLVKLKLLAFTIEVTVWWIVFSLHGGTMAGGFAATIAALLAGLILPRMVR